MPVNSGGQRHCRLPFTSKQVPELQYEPTRLHNELVVLCVVVVVVNTVLQRIPVHPGKHVHLGAVATIAQSPLTQYPLHSK